jgi:hypothetical protein
MEIISWEWGNHLAAMRFINNRSGDELQPRRKIQPEGSSSKFRDEQSKLRGEEMTIQCGICEHKGSLADAPAFLCFNCCDAIRRLVRISEHEQVRAEYCEPVESTERAGVRVPRSAVLGKR